MQFAKVVYETRVYRCFECYRGSKRSAKAQSKHESRTASRCDLETKGADQQMNNFVPQDISLAMTVMPIFGSGGGQAPTKEALERSTCSNITKAIKDLYPEDAELQSIAKQISKVSPKEVFKIASASSFAELILKRVLSLRKLY